MSFLQLKFHVDFMLWFYGGLRGMTNVCHYSYCTLRTARINGECTLSLKYVFSVLCLKLSKQWLKIWRKPQVQLKHLGFLLNKIWLFLRLKEPISSMSSQQSSTKNISWEKKIHKKRKWRSSQMAFKRKKVVLKVFFPFHRNIVLDLFVKSSSLLAKLSKLAGSFSMICSHFYKH